MEGAVMTTKSFSAGSFLASSEYGERHTATGGDGKFEVVNGLIREKWNNYSREDEVKIAKTAKVNGFSYFMNTTVTTTVPSKMDLQAQNKLIHKVKGFDFNLAVAVAEGTQTVKMVKGNLYALGSAALDLRRGDLSSALRRFSSQFDVNSSIFSKRDRASPFKLNGRLRTPSPLTTKDLAGRWLETQYGWLPLMSDVYNASIAYEKLTRLPRTEKLKAVVYSQSNQNTSASPTLYTVDTILTQRARYQYELREVIAAERVLGLEDPLSVVWELIPYSFVVDWFIPIGTYLENLNMAPKLVGRSCKTLSTRQVSKGVANKSSNYIDAKLHYEYYKLDRTVGTGFQGTVLPSFKSFPEAMSPKHIWNAIALARQRFA